MENTLENYGRYLLLQSQLPKLETEKEDARRLALAAERERNQREAEWEYLKNPGFFQRLLGKVEEKKAAAYRAYQDADTAWKAACRTSEQAAAALQKVKEELDGLAESEVQYAQLPKGQEMAVEAFRPAALYNLEMALDALEQALQWENRERNVGGRLPNQDDGMWEQLAAAKEPAKRLKYILEQFPEPDSWACEYLRNPDGFIYDGVVMKISPRNKIRMAIGQLEKLKIRLQ